MTAYKDHSIGTEPVLCIRRGMQQTNNISSFRPSDYGDILQGDNFLEVAYSAWLKKARSWDTVGKN